MMTTWFIKNILEFTSGREVTVDRNTTLNEKYNVLPNERPKSGEFPTISYIGIGMGGIGDNTKLAYHRAVDASLFEPIPFICREIEFDLSPTDRNKYRMRVVKTIDGVDYAFYYLKKLPLSSDRVEVRKLIKDSSTAATIVDLDSDDPTILSPVPKYTGELDLTKSEFYVVDSRINFNLTLEDKIEIKNAYSIMFQTEDIPPVTEVGVFYGADSLVSISGIEAVSVRPAYFYTVPYEIQNMLFVDDITQRYIDIGGMRMR